MSFPWRDWQFWVATIIALAAAWYVLRNLIPPGLLPPMLRKKPPAKKATLTIEGKRVPKE